MNTTRAEHLARFGPASADAQHHVAAHLPHLRPAVAANPLLHDDVARWLARHGDAAVRARLAWHATLGTPHRRFRADADLVDALLGPSPTITTRPARLLALLHHTLPDDAAAHLRRRLTLALTEGTATRQLADTLCVNAPTDAISDLAAAHASWTPTQAWAIGAADRVDHATIADTLHAAYLRTPARQRRTLSVLPAFLIDRPAIRAHFVRRREFHHGDAALVALILHTDPHPDEIAALLDDPALPNPHLIRYLPQRRADARACDSEATPAVGSRLADLRDPDAIARVIHWPHDPDEDTILAHVRNHAAVALTRNPLADRDRIRAARAASGPLSNLLDHALSTPPDQPLVPCRPVAPKGRDRRSLLRSAQDYYGTRIPADHVTTTDPAASISPQHLDPLPGDHDDDPHIFTVIAAALAARHAIDDDPDAWITLLTVIDDWRATDPISHVAATAAATGADTTHPRAAGR